MTRSLPYPGHSWGLTQHAIGNDPTTLYKFLRCVAPFEGETEGYDEKINALMSATGVLTENVRDGVPDAWRDYQQILSELGLIYSTTVVQALTLTELGQMFLAGEIGFSELIGAQCLRYQYPNGQKSTIQARLRRALSAACVSMPDSVMELQANSGILLKPAVLILRVLLGLLDAKSSPRLTIAECQASLIPCKTNKDWLVALTEISSIRASGKAVDPSLNRHSRRNLQDWFKLLKKSDLFESDGHSWVGLSAYARGNASLMASICDHEEDAGTFWIPPGYDGASRKTWFDWFGHLPFGSQAVIRSDVSGDGEYLAKNYVGGLEDDDSESGFTGGLEINLQPVDLSHLGRATEFSFSGDIEQLLAGLKKGAEKRHAKTLLHDKIVKDLAELFISQGASVQSDPNSIDLLSTWPSGNSAIFEVKTVTRRSLQGRLRTAIGQVEEYAYRRYVAGAGVADKVVVVNAELQNESWQTKFMTDYLRIGLICVSAKLSYSYHPPTALTRGYWP